MGTGSYAQYGWIMEMVIGFNFFDVWTVIMDSQQISKKLCENCRDVIFFFFFYDENTMNIIF